MIKKEFNWAVYSEWGVVSPTTNQVLIELIILNWLNESAALILWWYSFIKTVDLSFYLVQFSKQNPPLGGSSSKSPCPISRLYLNKVNRLKVSSWNSFGLNFFFSPWSKVKSATTGNTRRESLQKKIRINKGDNSANHSRCPSAFDWTVLSHDYDVLFGRLPRHPDWLARFKLRYNWST